MSGRVERCIDCPQYQLAMECLGTCLLTGAAVYAHNLPCELAADEDDEMPWDSLEEDDVL